MLSFNPSTIEDIQQLQEWIAADPDHCGKMDPSWWLTGNDCIFAGRLQDKIGSIVYFRLDREVDLARLHVQFAPEGYVAKGRLIKALLTGYYQVESLIRKKGFKGIIFDSTNISLIQFMAKLGFQHKDKDDYQLLFEESV